MNSGLLLLLVIIVGLPIGWLVSEFCSGRPLRIALGILAILCSFGVAALIGKLSELSYNAWYGASTKDLINTIVEEIEDGQIDRVMTVLRSINRQYQPTYEEPPSHYRLLVADAAARMRGDTEIEQRSVWDATTFDHSTWLGHWENDTGFWIVINDAESPYDIVRSGDPGMRMTSVVLSNDCQILTFKEDTRWRHTLTLVNKYEAKHTWFDIEKNTVWQTDYLYKLTRTSQEQRGMTRQDTVK
jgi:hypothetical protein